MAELPVHIGRYEVISRLGQGGMGSLYLAKDPKIGRLVAIKLVRQEFDTPEARQRFAREAQSAGTLRHPNIVTIFDVDAHDGLPFIAMEYVDGETLGELIRRKAPLSLSKRLKWIEDLCLGLAYAHRQGVVHRDVKPANLMLDAEGALKILDFGLARREASKFTQSHVIIGTPNYMSPEQIGGGEVGPRSDIFAVGAVLYEVISYNEAFPGSVHQAMHTIMYAQPVPLEEILPGLDRGLTAIVDRALDKDPDRRYQDLALLRADLTEVRQRLETKIDDSAQTIPMDRRGGHSRPTPRSGPGSDHSKPGGRPTPPSGGSKRFTTDRLSLQKKRTAQIDTHLTAARGHFEAGDLEKARESCEQALMFDTEHPVGLQLMDEIAAEEESRQIAALVTSARAELQRGHLEAAERIVAEALAIAPHHPQVVQLRETIETTRRELLRARQVQETLRRARGQFAEGAFEVAVRTASEVLAIDPENVPARDLQTRGREAIENRDKKAERDAAAQAAVTDARELFERGEKTAALAKLEAFSPPHDLVTGFLASLRNVGEDSSVASAARAGPETAQFMPGRSADAAHVASHRTTMYLGVAAALVILAVALGVLLTQTPDAPTNTAAGAPAGVGDASTATNPTTPATSPTATLPPPPVVTPPASLTAVPPVDQTGRDLLEAYRLLAQGQRAAAEKIAAQIRRLDPKNVELAKLTTAIQQWGEQDKLRAEAMAANAAAANPPAGGAPPAAPVAAPAPDPQPAQPEPKPAAAEPVFSVLPGGGFAADSAPAAPPLLSELERPGIEAAVRTYEKALSSKDIRAVSRIRTLTEQQRSNWVKTFDRVRTYRLIVNILAAPAVEADGTKATLMVEERVQQVDKNNFEVNTGPTKMTYKLEKIGGSWRILPPQS